jgi:hypothetical protein
MTTLNDLRLKFASRLKEAQTVQPPSQQQSPDEQQQQEQSQMQGQQPTTADEQMQPQEEIPPDQKPAAVVNPLGNLPQQSADELKMITEGLAQYTNALVQWHQNNFIQNK